MGNSRKKNLSEKLQNKKLPTKKQLNPFEVHINKEKLSVLGRKIKNDRGLPGVSRSKAISKRKNTLLQEYKHLNKSNKFLDKRIGEKNYLLEEEDRTIARFAAVRMKAHKKSIYNLADDEILTHKGQSLSQIEKFDDPRSDDDDDNEFDKSGNLDRKFVEEAHFGGGILTNTNREGAKTHKDLIDQLIAESKKRKAEKQKTKEATLELTEKLDSEWKDLLPIVNKSRKCEEVKAKIDDYDKVMGELRFEAKGTVSDRLKTDNEVAKEEEEKLQQLEKERLERMKGILNKEQTQTHKSADDLDDFNYESDPEYMLTYNEEGIANVEVSAEISGKTVEESDEDTIDEESEDESESDNLSDLKAESSESETEDTVNSEKVTEEEIKIDVQQRKEMLEKVRQELPYTFSIPDSYEDLDKLLKNQSNDHKSVIIERMIKCNHPSLKEGNKDNLGLLFVYLLQYLNDVAQVSNEETIRNCFETFAILMPHLGELAKLHPENARHSLKDVIREKHELYRKRKRQLPGLEMLLFFRLVCSLYSTSDFRHEIVTPCLIFMEQILNNCRINNKCDISYGLFITTLILEATQLSKRFLPATINFLAGLLHMAIPKIGVKLIKVSPPFKSTANLLVLHGKCAEFNDFKMQITDLLNTDINGNYKIRTVFTTLKLLEEFCVNFSDLASNIEIFSPLIGYLQQIPCEYYPEIVTTQFGIVLDLFNKQKSDRKLCYVVMEAKKPKALRLYEPKIEEVFDGKRRRNQSRDKAEREKMLHKLKKETKGALREIRRDKAFLGGVKIRQQIKSDKERKEKVKKIYAEAAIQQSELNSMDRKKKKK